MKFRLVGALAGAVLSVAVVHAASAADMPLKAAPMIVASTWTGCYIGINGGYSKARAHVTDLAGVPITDPYNPDGGLLGGTLGCNQQRGQFVLGVEGDWDWSGVKGSAPNIGVNAGFTDTTTQNWIATARGRLGYAWDRWMIFGTGGLAMTSLREFTFNGPLTATATQTRTVFGWTAGVGVETMVAAGWSVKVEYLYADFGKTKFFGPGANGTLAAGFLGENVAFSQHMFRGGLNYKFWAF